MAETSKDQVGRLDGSRDPRTGDVFCPPRAFAADGSLRRCEGVSLEGVGTLYSWTRFARMSFGQIDLRDGVRIQTRLDGDDHAIGATYALKPVTNEAGEIEERFVRVGD